MATFTRYCDVPPVRRNPPGVVPSEPLPPGSEIPPDELPDPVDPPPPVDVVEPPPPDPGDILSDLTEALSREIDEIIEELIAAAPAEAEAPWEDDELTEEVLVSPDFRIVQDAADETEELLEELIAKEPSLLGDGWEEDELDEDVVVAPGGVFAVTATDTTAEDEAATLTVVPAPALLVLRTELELVAESDVLTHVVVPAPPPPPPPQVILGLAVQDISAESDLLSSEVLTLPAPPEPELPPPPDPGSWHRILQNQTYFGDIVVPAGERWLIGPGVKIQGNLRTMEGTIGMRPGSSLEFINANMNSYVGGGMRYDPIYANDYGIWCGDDGTLDFQGTPKVGWTRTGMHSTWLPTDEMYVAPTDHEDFFVRRWYAGDPVPQVHASEPPTEIINVTRDIVIKGPGHIHIHSHHPQRIEYVRLEGMGISNVASAGPVMGRYALHFHHGFDGSRGTVVRGVAAINSTGRVYVPHLSNGISFNDCVSVSSWGEAFWWDLGDNTNDVLVDRLCVSGVQMPDTISGQQSGTPGVSLPSGTGMVMRNTAVSAVFGGKMAVGFDWPEPTAIFGPNPTLVWVFDEGNVAHNCRGPGVRFWTNNQDQHVVRNYRSYRNAGGSVENGAYFGINEYHDVISYHDGFYFGNDFSANNAAFSLNSSGADVGPGFAQQIRDSSFISHGGPALEIGHRQLPATAYTECSDLVLTPAAGFPKVRVVPTTFNPAKVHFLRCGLVPADVVFDDYVNGNEGSHIKIENANGHGTNINITGGVRVETPF